MTEDLVGKEISQEILQSLITNGRIKFKPKDTSPLGSAISVPADEIDHPKEQHGLLDSEGDEFSTGKDVDGLIAEVAKNEEIVKTLEDLYDDMTRDMKIPSATKSIAEAANLLGAKDGIITKKILDWAENIMDMYPYTVGLGNPFLGGLTGDPSIKGDYLQCNEITKDYATLWKTNINTAESGTSEELLQQNNNAARQVQEDFKKKMKQLFIYMMKLLWWEQIYARVIIVFLGILEKSFAKPVDTLFLLIKFKKLTQKNFEKYGLIHKLINKIKLILLCQVPKAAFPEYKPDDQITIFLPSNPKNKKEKGEDKPDSEKIFPKVDGYYPLVDFCSNASKVDECITELFAPEEASEDNLLPKNPTVSNLVNNQTDSLAQIESEDPCSPTDFLKSLLFKPGEGQGDSGLGVGVSPACVAAAKTILEAVKNDALYFGDYDTSTVNAVTTGNVGTL